MKLLGMPNDVTERIASMLLRLRDRDGPDGGSFRSRWTMVAGGGALLSLSATCTELRRLLERNGMRREARARCDTIIWPSLRVEERVLRTPTTLSHVYTAQRQEEKHSKAQLKMLRSAIGAFACGTPRSAHRRAFVEEQAEAGKQCRARVIFRATLDSEDAPIVGVTNGFLLRTEEKVHADGFLKLQINRYEDAAVSDHSFGDEVASIALLDHCEAPGYVAFGADDDGIDMVDVYSATGDLVFLSIALKFRDDQDVICVSYEHHRLNRATGTVEQVFKTCMNTYAVDDPNYGEYPVCLMLSEEGGHYALTTSIENGPDTVTFFGQDDDVRYTVAKVTDGDTKPLGGAFGVAPDPAAGNVTCSPGPEETQEFLKDWLLRGTACTRGLVAVSTMFGLRIHSGRDFQTTERIPFKHRIPRGNGMLSTATRWTPMQPRAFSENGQFLLMESCDSEDPGPFVLARDGTTGLFGRYPVAALRAEPGPAVVSGAVFTECSRYCLFQGAWGRASRCWFYIDLVEVFSSLVPSVHAQSRVVATGRPLVPSLGREFPAKQPLSIRFASDGVSVRCADESLLRFTTERAGRNPQPPVPR